MRRAVVAVAGLVLACAASPIHRGCPAPSPESVSFDSVSAPWLEERTESWSTASVYYADGEVVALGAHVALLAASVGSRSSVVALHDERGILGIVDRRDARWVGLDGADAIYRVLDGGVFERASDAVAASDDAWEVRASVPDADVFATAGSVVAAAAMDAVHVSVDGAASFRRSVPRPGSQVEELYARHDGVLVASVRKTNGREELFVSSDRGAHWGRSTLQTGGIDQMGAWIYSLCAGAILSTDAKTWVEARSFLEFDTEPLSRTVGNGTELVAYQRPEFLSQTVPPAPETKDETAIVGQHPCQERSHRTRAPRVRLAPSYVRGCDGVGCLRYRDLSYPSRTKIELLQDGLCAPHDRWESRECPLAVPLVRAPHALVVDSESKSARVVELPAGCRPMTIRSGGGIAVLVCLDGERTLFVADRSGIWHAESGLAVSESSAKNPLQIAPDGTILFHDHLGDVPGSYAWVRAPLPLGERSAWRRIGYKNVVAYSVAPGGRALVAMMLDGDLPDIFTLFLDEPGQRPRSLGIVAFGGRRVLQICGARDHVRLLFESEQRFEVHALKNGRLAWLGDLPDAAYEEWTASTDHAAAELCSDELVLLRTTLTNGAERR